MGKRDEGSAARPAKFVLLAVACAATCIAVGIASVALTPRNGWYQGIRKPTWMPPGWLVGVVWTLLYAMTAVALAIILQRGWRTGVARATTLFLIQLALGAAWSPIFFGLHSHSGAMAVSMLLWLMVGWTVAAFWSVRDIAGLLLLPYWLWVTFAVALNVTIWRMNG